MAVDLAAAAAMMMRRLCLNSRRLLDVSEQALMQQ